MTKTTERTDTNLAASHVTLTVPTWHGKRINMTAAEAMTIWAKNTTGPVEAGHVDLARRLLETQANIRGNPDAVKVRDYLEGAGVLPALDFLDAPTSVLPLVTS